MKTIQAIPMWDKGQSKEATILNAYAVNVSLNQSATFWYGLFTNDMEQLTQGNLTMSGEEYQEWANNDDYAWDFIAGKLSLVITGDYVKHDPIVSEQVVEI